MDPQTVTMRHAPSGRVETRSIATVDYWSRHGWEVVDPDPPADPESEAAPEPAAEDAPGPDTKPPASPRQARQQSRGVKTDARADV